jgi:hypothetical protein
LTWPDLRQNTTHRSGAVRPSYASYAMGKPPTQVESFESPDIDHEKDLSENGVNPKAAKAMYIVIGLVLLALFVLVGVGLHIPTGG